MTKAPPKRLLVEAVAHVGKEVIIIAPGINGSGYLATSMPTCSSANIERMMTLTNEALKRMRRWHRQRQKQEKVMAGKKKVPTATVIKAAVTPAVPAAAGAKLGAKAVEAVKRRQGQQFRPSRPTNGTTRG